MVEALNRLTLRVKGFFMTPKRSTVEEGRQAVDEHYASLTQDDKVDASEAERRKAVCDGCNNKVQHFKIDMCQDCYCFIKLKTALKNATCPLDKW